MQAHCKSWRLGSGFSPNILTASLIPRIDTFGVAVYKLFSTRLWPCWGSVPPLLPGLRVTTPPRYRKAGTRRALLSWPGTASFLLEPLFRDSALLPLPTALRLQSLFGFTVPRGPRGPACPPFFQTQASKNSIHTPLQLPRAHPVFVESVPAELSEVYLKGHLRANEDTPLLAPARRTGSAVQEANFFCGGEGGRFCGERGESPRLQEEPRTPTAVPAWKPLPKPGAAAARLSAPGEGEEPAWPPGTEGGGEEEGETGEGGREGSGLGDAAGRGSFPGRPSAHSPSSQPRGAARSDWGAPQPLSRGCPPSPRRSLPPPAVPHCCAPSISQVRRLLSLAALPAHAARFLRRRRRLLSAAAPPTSSLSSSCPAPGAPRAPGPPDTHPFSHGGGGERGVLPLEKHREEAKAARGPGSDEEGARAAAGREGGRPAGEGTEAAAAAGAAAAAAATCPPPPAAPRRPKPRRSSSPRLLLTS